MGKVGGNRDFGFVWQEAINGLGAGKDVGMKLCIPKFNLAAGDTDWSRKGQRWGDQPAEIQRRYSEDLHPRGG